MQGDLLLFRRLDFLKLSIGEDGNTTIAGVDHHVVHNLSHLLLQFVDKLFGIVFLVLDIAQFLLPDTR